MILVDVHVPATDTVYDFMLDENTEIGTIIQELIEMIAKKMNKIKIGDYKNFTLFSIDKEIPLDREKTLLASGISDGSRLLLI